MQVIYKQISQASGKISKKSSPDYPKRCPLSPNICMKSQVPL